jgi:hypothetical protein
VPHSGIAADRPGDGHRDKDLILSIHHPVLEHRPLELRIRFLQSLRQHVPSSTTVRHLHTGCSMQLLLDKRAILYSTPPATVWRRARVPPAA